MRFFSSRENLLPAALLLAIGIALVAFNLIVTARRSLIPLALDAEVIDIDIRREKHPPLDDVHLVTFSDGRTMQVDREIAGKFIVGDQLRKRRSETTLLVNDRPLALAWSADAQGMSPAMRVAAIALAGVAVMAASSRIA